MKDRFSNHAKQYASFRPTYPTELYNFIFSHLDHFDIAWDAGTGNGQVAADIAKRFEKVLATEFRGYLGTSSSVQKYIQANGTNPVDNLNNAIRN